MFESLISGDGYLLAEPQYSVVSFFTYDIIFVLGAYQRRFTANVIYYKSILRIHKPRSAKFNFLLERIVFTFFDEVEAFVNVYFTLCLFVFVSHI